MDMALTPEEQFEVFGTDKMAEDAEEARHRYGQTDAGQRSKLRISVDTKDDWLTIKAEADADIQGFAELLRAGVLATWTAAMDLAEAHRQHLIRWFNHRGYPAHRGLAELNGSGLPGTSRPTTRSRRASPGTCTTRSWPTPLIGARPVEPLPRGPRREDQRQLADAYDLGGEVTGGAGPGASWVVGYLAVPLLEGDPASPSGPGASRGSGAARRRRPGSAPDGLNRSRPGPGAAAGSRSATATTTRSSARALLDQSWPATSTSSVVTLGTEYQQAAGLLTIRLRNGAGWPARRTRCSAPR